MQCSEEQEAVCKPKKFCYDCETFAGNAKISQSYQKFRNPSEIEKFR